MTPTGPSEHAAKTQPATTDSDAPKSARPAGLFRLTTDAHAGLDSLATRFGITKVSLIEALGRLGRSSDPSVRLRLEEQLQDVIALAREIDGRRRSRRRDQPAAGVDEV